MKVVKVFFILVALVFQQSQVVNADLKHNVVTKRSIPKAPTTQCIEKSPQYNKENDPSTVWICVNSKWQPYRIVPVAGQTKQLSASSCNEIKKALTTYSCSNTLKDGIYWVQGQQIYCSMTIDKGGWTLVWQHAYMELPKPLTTDMFYFSDHNRPCVKDPFEKDWCNVPNKARFNPTHQMIVAYHKDKIVYAYKGYFNCLIDERWSGGILLNPKMVIDNCKNYKGIAPAPSVHVIGIFGLTFDKQTPSDYNKNCDTYGGGSTLEVPKDCRWHDCGLPSSISGDMNDDRNTDMTMAIFVR